MSTPRVTLGQGMLTVAVAAANLAAVRAFSQGLLPRAAVLGGAFGMLSLAAWRAASRRGRYRAAAVGYLILGGAATLSFLSALWSPPSTWVGTPAGVRIWMNGPVVATGWRWYSSGAIPALASVMPGGSGREAIAALAVMLAPQVGAGLIGAALGLLIRSPRTRPAGEGPRPASLDSRLGDDPAED